MKKLALVLAVAGALMVSAGAYAAVQNMAVGAYKNMAGTPFKETITLTVTADLIGPNINMTKNQTNLRTSQSGPTIMIASGDSIQYQIMFSNNGTDSAQDLVITDTLSFEVVGGQTVSYVSGTATDSGAPLGLGTVKLLEYCMSSVWMDGISATIPANCEGIRWTIDYVGVGGPYPINFTVQVTTP